MLLRFAKLRLALIATCTCLMLSGAQAADSPEDSAAQIARTLVSKTLPGGPGTVAVGAVTHGDGNCSELTRFLEEELVDALFNANAPGVNIIERSQLFAIFKELELTYDGTITPDTATKIGEIKGVRGVVSGKITVINERVLFRVRLIDTTDGTIFSSSRSEFPATESLKNMMSARSSENCGFDQVSVTPDATTAVTGTTIATPSQSVITHSANGIVVSVTSARRLDKGKSAFFKVLLENQSGADVAVAYNRETFSAISETGYNFEKSVLWKGFPYCGTSYIERCIDPNDDEAALVRSGGILQHSARLQYSQDVGATMSLSFDLIIRPDLNTSEYWVETVTFLDVPLAQ